MRLVSTCSGVALLTLLMFGQLGAQDAAPEDRNSVNSRFVPGDMKADSPVTFPERGALPSKYPPDVKTERIPTEKDYFMFSSPCRSLEQIRAIQAEMPPGEFTVPTNDWEHLEQTRRVLLTGGKLNILGLGDSIINDTMRSGWIARLREAYPKAEINATVYVRGGGGCQHYKEEGRITKNVVPLKPDLVIIGGISQRDIQSIAEVIHQLRDELPNVEFLLTSGVFGTTDPRDEDRLSKARHSGSADYGRSLQELAARERCAYLDMTTPWARYIRSTGLHPHLFYRDAVHANAQGEQILSRILMAFFSQPAKREIKVLGVGNSFTVNAFSLLSAMGDRCDKVDLVLGSAVIGGCSMEKHVRLAKLHEEDPESEEGRPYWLTLVNAEGTPERTRVGLREMLASDDWDIVTIQQLSAQSPDIDNYRPYAKELHDYITRYAPQAEVVLHQTWAYRTDGDFQRVFPDKPGYGQLEMYRDLNEAYNTIAEELGVRLIPVGTAFQLARQVRPYLPDAPENIRNLAPPNLPNDRNSLCVGWYWDKSDPPNLRSDTHHAGSQGCYLASSVWFEFLTGLNVGAEGIEAGSISDDEAEFLAGIAHQVVTEGKRPNVE